MNTLAKARALLDAVDERGLSIHGLELHVTLSGLKKMAKEESDAEWRQFLEHPGSPMPNTRSPVGKIAAVYGVAVVHHTDNDPFMEGHDVRLTLVGGEPL